MEGTQSLRENVAAGLRRAKQRKSCTHHQYHLPTHQSLRGPEGGWALRFRLRRSGPGRGEGWLCGDSLGELGSSEARAREWSDIAEGNWEEVWTHRRSNVPLLERARREGADCHRNVFTTHGLSEGGAMGSEAPLGWATGGATSCMG